MICGAKLRTGRATLLGSCVWMALHAAPSAADVNLQADLGAEYSDNIGRVPADEESDTIGSARLGIGIEEMRPRLEATVDGDLQFRHYFDGTFDDEIVGGLSGNVAWSILPERFIWVVEDNYGQVSANRAAPDSPSNRQDFNYFTTGPDFLFRMGTRSFAELSGRWSDVYYEDADATTGPIGVGSNQGSENLEGSVAFGRSLSDETTVSLNGSVQEIDYDDERFGDYQITEGFVRYASEGSRTELSIDAGYTNAERENESTGGLLARLNVSREITSRSTVSLEAGSEFADTATAFRLDQVAGGVSPESEDALAANDVFRTTYAYLSFNTERERTSFEVGINGRQERHESETETDLDRDSVGASVSWLRRLSLRLDLEIRAAYTQEEYVETEFSFDEWSAGVGMSWRLTDRFSLRFTADHFAGSSDGSVAGAGVGVRDYEENRLFLGVRYASLRR